MPRFKPMKTKKAAKKRFKITATGKIMRSGAGKRHLLGGKSSKQKRRLGRAKTVSETHMRHINESLPFNHRG
jgi:large subunit ribosomal protein L35